MLRDTTTNFISKRKYNLYEYNDPFSLTKKTSIVHLNPYPELSSMERSALLSRYSRSNKSITELIDSEFVDTSRGEKFINRVLNEYGDDSIAEMASESIGIEGLSLLAASKLTDRRIGISFIEKSTRYIDYDKDSFYTPSVIYETGLADSYHDLCAKSYNTFQKIFKMTKSDNSIDYPISSCTFLDSKTNKTVPFEQLSLEDDIKHAERAYERSVTNKAFDTASYCYLLSLKTNIGLNSNCRSLEYLLRGLHLSPLEELGELGYHLYTLLEKTIRPFITKASPEKFFGANRPNNLGVYTPNSTIAMYKSKFTKWLRDYDEFQEGVNENLSGEKKKVENHNTSVIKKILTELATSTQNHQRIEYSGIGGSSLEINSDLLNPWVSIVHFMEEKFYIDQLCAAIAYENNENLLEYDEQNINNIDNSLRILGIDTQNIKNGILYDILNDSRKIYQYDTETKLNKTTENTLKFNDISSYFQETAIMNDNLHMDYNSEKTTIDKEQEYLIKKYIGDRRSRRDRLGRSFEFINYMFEISSSYRIMREFKRHRLGSFLYPQVITARNSYDSFIFPTAIQQNREMFDIYKDLIDDSFSMYNKIVKKSNDYYTAQYALISGVRCNYVVNMNFRELDHFMSIRTIPQAHEEIRFICQMLYHLLKTIHPNIAKFLEFVDLSYYGLGRLTYEFRKEKRLDNSTR